MKRNLCVSAFFLFTFFLSCEKTQRDSAALENQKRSVIEDTTKMAAESNTAEQENGFTTGTIEDINFAVEDQGAITLKTEDGTEKLFHYSKSKTPIDSAMLNKKVRIFWSIQVDTTLDEANSFYMVDSIEIIG